MLTRGGYVICVSGVWTIEKGFKDIISLREILPKNELIVMVGVNKSQKLNLPDGIIGIERTSNQNELATLYSGADALINPTWGDTFGMVNIESLACGTPVITYNTGGSPEAIDDKTGKVVAQGEIREMANSIMDILNNPPLYSPFECRKRVETNFNKQSQYDLYINLYNSLITR